MYNFLCILEKRVPDFLPIEDGDIKSALTKYSLKVNRYVVAIIFIICELFRLYNLNDITEIIDDLVDVYYYPYELFNYFLLHTNTC